MPHNTTITVVAHPFTGSGMNLFTQNHMIPTIIQNIRKYTNSVKISGIAASINIKSPY